MKVVKILRTHYGRTVIPKQVNEKDATFKALLEARKLDMTPAEKAVVDKYLNGESTLEAVKEELMKLPIE